MTSKPIKSFRPLPMLPTALAMAAVVALIGTARLLGVRPEASLPTSAAFAQRVLSFEDAKGMVIVRDADTGEIIQQFGKGEGTFVRATLRALVNDRKKQGISKKEDFRLEAHKGPQFYLIDEASGRTISLNAFGPSNTAVFAAFINTNATTTANKGESQ